MPEVSEIIEYKNIHSYLEARGLLKQYQKAKQILLSGDWDRVRFKEREPQNSGIWYFRINKKFRARGIFLTNGKFAVSGIDNHQ